MKTKLKDITTQYSKFNTNQVLTENQLNEFLDYFDDQDRLTRTGLSGVGIVCGFKVTYNEKGNSIEITQGRGVTTDGDLLALQNQSTTEEGKKDDTLKSIDLLAKNYRFYKKYVDDNVEYKHFLDADEKQIDLWELYENDDESHTDLAAFPNIKDMVVLLYLEHYSKEGDLCTQLTCDNQGIEQVARLRVLLVSIEDAEYIAGRDSIYNKHNWYELYEALPEVCAKRVVLTCKNTKTFTRLKQNYYNAIKNTDTLTNLGIGLNAIFTKFNKDKVASAINDLFDFSSNGVPTDYQYRYDILKDLIDTYNEIKALLLHINVECCPSIGAFPKHLMLGRIDEVKPYLTLRHQFYKSPIVGYEDKNYKKTISLLKRVIALVGNYVNFNKGNTIKITPSQAYGELGNKAIPFYYNVNDPILKPWSFEKSSNFKHQYNLSYHTQNLANVPIIQKPLDYNIDPFNFYRIEGHQGKMYKEALDGVLRLKEANGLNFDVKMLSINATTKTIDINDYKCQFEDLSILLTAWRTEQNCVLAEMSRFFSGFSTVDAGTNVVAVNNGLQLESLTAVLTSAGDEVADMGITMAEAPGVGTAVVDAELAGFSPVNKMNKQKDLFKVNIVQEELTVEENTLGLLLQTAIKDNEEGSANDIMAALSVSTEEILTSEAWAEEAPLGEFIFTNVAETLVHSYILDNRIPTQITEIDSLTLSTYKLTIDQLCKRVKALQAKYQTTTVKEGSKQILGLLINQLSTVCCSGKKLEILLKEIEKRKQEILLQIQLSEFVKKHPGLEHKAGVQPGGTFVMVYLTENASDKPTYETVTMELDFLEQPNIDDDGLDGDEGVLKLWNDRVSTKFAFLHKVIEDTQNPLDEIVFIGETIDETVSNFAVFLNRIWKRAGDPSVFAKADRQKLIIRIKDRAIQKDENFIQFYNPAIVGVNTKIYFEENTVLLTNTTAKNTVIADFALPYMCCSDCTPINFIVPKDPISLSLPVAFICLEDDEEIIPIPFKKSPSDGEIKALVPDDVESGLTTNEEGKEVFDASLTDPSLYGTEIRFTVDEEETEAKITVYPDLNISVNTQVSYNETNTLATVTYTVSSVVPNLGYTWDFGIGEPSNEVPNSDGEILMEYELPVNDANTIMPKLTISNGFCEDVIPMEPIAFEDSISVALEIQETYCLDLSSEATVKIPFTTIEPVDGTIEIVNANIPGIQVEDGELVIDPITFTDVGFNTEIHFTIAGLATDAKITIFPLTQIDIVEDPGGFIWEGDNLHHSYFFGANVPTGTDESNLSYQWTINGVEVSQNNSLEHNFLIQQGDNTFEVTLSVTNENGCVSTATTMVTIAYPDFKLEMPNDKLEYCLIDNSPYLITISPNIFGTEVEGLGVSLNTAGNTIFRPKATNLAAEGTITLGIAGKTLLTITLNEAPIAGFTRDVSNEKLTLTNTSDLADTYVWNVGGQVITRTTRSAVVLDVNSFETAIIDISLVVTGECGQNTVEETNVRVRPDVPVSCIPDTTQVILEDSSTLSSNLDVSTSIRDGVLIPTIELYQAVNNAPEDFLKGTNNSELNAFGNLFAKTVPPMVENSQDSFVYGIVSQFYRAQIKLFFNVLHCQSHDVLTTDKDIITNNLNRIKNGFETLKNQGLGFDPNNELKDYLTAYSEELQVIEYIKTFIVDELMALI